MEKELDIELVTSVEAELKKEKEEFAKALSKDDFKKIASYFSEDAVRVGFNGEIAKGIKEIEQAFKNARDKFADATVEFEDGEIRMLGDDHVLWRGGFSIRKPDGSPPILGYVVQISRREGNKWLIIEAHPKIIDAGPRK